MKSLLPLLPILAALLAGGCSGLPSHGPTAHIPLIIEATDRTSVERLQPQPEFDTFLPTIVKLERTPRSGYALGVLSVVHGQSVDDTKHQGDAITYFSGTLSASDEAGWIALGATASAHAAVLNPNPRNAAMKQLFSEAEAALGGGDGISARLKWYAVLEREPIQGEPVSILSGARWKTEYHDMLRAEEALLTAQSAAGAASPLSKPFLDDVVTRCTRHLESAQRRLAASKLDTPANSPQLTPAVISGEVGDAIASVQADRGKLVAHLVLEAKKYEGGQDEANLRKSATALNFDKTILRRSMTRLDWQILRLPIINTSVWGKEVKFGGGKGGSRWIWQLDNSPRRVPSDVLTVQHSVLFIPWWTHSYGRRNVLDAAEDMAIREYLNAERISSLEAAKDQRIWKDYLELKK